MNLKIYIFYLLILHSCLTAQRGCIEGIVVDARHQPIADLHVILSPSRIGTTTDRTGHFFIENIQSGQYELFFDHIAFKNHKISNIKVMGDEHIHLQSIVLESQVLPLPGVVVTATRSQRSITDISQAMNVVTQEAIVARHAKTAAEVLREEPGIFVQKTSHGGGSAVIRGLSSNQVLIMVDGIRLNNSTYRLGNHPYLTLIDPAMVHQIEVVRGPSSSLYGSDAMGGTIHLLTKRPPLAGKRWQLGGRFFSRYATADAEKTGRAEIYLSKARFSLQTGMSYLTYGDLRRGSRSHQTQLEKSTQGLYQNPSGYNALYLDSKCIFDLSLNQNIIFAFQKTQRNEVPRYDKYENNGYFKWLYHPQNRDLFYITYRYARSGEGVTSMESSISYQRQVEGREIQQDVFSPMTKEKDDIGTYGIGFQIHAIYGKHFFTLGGDGYFDYVQSSRFSKDAITGIEEKENRGRYPNRATYQSYGLFIQDEWNMSSVWRIIAGMRANFLRALFVLPADLLALDQNHEMDQQFQSLTGHFGLVRKIKEGFFLNANIGQAFRAPNLSDLSKLGESKGDTYEVPNPDLSPEKMINFDVGVKVESERLKIQFAVYYAKIANLLASADAQYRGSPWLMINDLCYKVKSKQNIGRGTIYGSETSFSCQLKAGLNVFGNVTSTFGQNTTYNEPIGGIPPLFGLFGFQYQWKFSSFSLYTRFAGTQDRLSQDDLDDPRIPDNGTPGWQTINVRSSMMWKDSGRFQIAVENLLDVNYREHGSGINGPGRNLIVSLEFTK